MQMKARNMWGVVLGAFLLALWGCGESPDVDVMKAGLAKSGFSQVQAGCFAEKMKELGMEGEPYNYIANLMNEGVSEKKAVNKARRKYGADFKTPMEAARADCAN